MTSSENDQTPAGQKTGSALKGAAPALIAIGLVVWFALTNFDDVSVQFWIVTITVPLFVVIVIGLLLGIGVGYIAGRRGAKSGAKSSDK
ncbi:MAG: LapA family protein [Actinomycetota bacterium]